MEVKPTGGRRWLLVVAWLGGVLASGGCTGFLGHLGYWTGGSLVEPEYPGLEGQRVAVICVSDSSTYGTGTEGKALARHVGSLLAEHVTEIDLVSAAEVADWIDKNDWNEIDYREVGKGLKADRVVAIDLAGFRLHEDKVLYKGRAAVTIAVYNMTKGGREVFRRELPEITYPVNGYYHTTDTSEATFRKVFLQIISRRVARYFYPYDALEEFGPAPALVINAN